LLRSRCCAPELDSEHRLLFTLERIARAIHDWPRARPVLDPVPVLTIPGFSDNDSVEFYEDAHNVRFEPISRLPK
jgi:hypothetical protein